MSGKEKRREALLLGKKDMSFTEIMQAIEACRADDCDKCLLSGGPIAGWFPEDVPDCYTVLLKNAGEKAAAEKAAAHVWELSEREKGIIASLGK